MLCPPSPGAIHWEEEMQRENKNVLWKSCIFAKLEPSPRVGACGLPGPFLSALPHCAPFPSGLPSGAVVENPPANDQWRRRKRLRFDPWVGKIPWRRKRQSTPAFLPGEFHGQRRLVGYSPWGHKELDTIEHTHTHTHTHTYVPFPPSEASTSWNHMDDWPRPLLSPTLENADIAMNFWGLAGWIPISD